MKLTEEQIRAASVARLTLAMHHVHAAQNSLANAMNALASLRTMSPQVKVCTALHEKTREFWYRLDSMQSRVGLRLDDLNIAALEKRIDNAPSSSQPVANPMLEALKAISAAVDYCREHGSYPEGTVVKDEQGFDDWAADLADAAIEASRG